MINNVTLVGRLTKDPELRYTPNGVAVANFTLAVNRTFTNQNGDREADFIMCQVWRKAAENTANYLKKGSLAGITGRIQTRSYDGDDGKRVFVTEVVAESVQFLEPKGSGSGNQSNNDPGSPYDYQNNNQGNSQQQNRSQGQYGSSNQGNQQQGGGDPFAGQGAPIDISDDDLPF